MNSDANQVKSLNIIDVVCGVIRDQGGRYLACRRPQGKHLAGYWEFPGGKVNEGESMEFALVRELQEELDILVSVGKRLGEVSWNDSSTTIRLVPFLCEILSGQPQPLEHEEVRWCSSDEFGELEWAPADRPILDELIIKEF